jgi:hypothetical protein
MHFRIIRNLLEIPWVAYKDSNRPSSLGLDRTYRRHLATPAYKKTLQRESKLRRKFKERQWSFFPNSNRTGIF